MPGSESVHGMGAIFHGSNMAFFTAKAWQEDGVWNAEVIDLPIVVFGETFEEASKNLGEALCSHLKAAAETGSLEEILEGLPQLDAPKQSVEIDEPDEVFWRVSAPVYALGACH